MTDFNYKKYSLENLENWLNDAISSDNITPQEIYDVFVKVVSENYEYHIIQTSRINELLSLLKGYSSVNFDDNCTSFWETSHQEYLKTQEDKVVKWQLPVQVDGLTGDCYINLPDDLLEQAGLKEGDMVHWIDRKDGSFEMRKVNGTQ